MSERTMEWVRLANRKDLIGEVARLRAELARRDEQIAAVRVLHEGVLLGVSPIPYCSCCREENGFRIHCPCPTIRALDGGAS